MLFSAPSATYSKRTLYLEDELLASRGFDDALGLADPFRLVKQGLEVDPFLKRRRHADELCVSQDLQRTRKFKPFRDCAVTAPDLTNEWEACEFRYRRQVTRKRPEKQQEHLDEAEFCLNELLDDDVGRVSTQRSREVRRLRFALEQLDFAVPPQCASRVYRAELQIAVETPKSDIAPVLAYAFRSSARFQPLDDELVVRMITRVLHVICEGASKLSEADAKLLGRFVRSRLSGAQSESPSGPHEIQSANQLWEEILYEELRTHPASRETFRQLDGVPALIRAFCEQQTCGLVALLDVATLHMPSQEEAAVHAKVLAKHLCRYLQKKNSGDEDERGVEACMRCAMNVTHRRKLASEEFISVGFTAEVIHLLRRTESSDVEILALGTLASLSHDTSLTFSNDEMEVILRHMVSGGPATGYGSILIGHIYHTHKQLLASLGVQNPSTIAGVVTEFRQFLQANRTLTPGTRAMCLRAEHRLQAPSVPLDESQQPHAYASSLLPSNTCEPPTRP